MTGAVSRGDEQGAAAEQARWRDIAQAITHPIGARAVHGERRGGVPEEPDARLAAVARAGDRGVMGAEVGGVQMRVVRREQLGEAALHGTIGGRVVYAARDPRLV